MGPVVLLAPLLLAGPVHPRAGEGQPVAVPDRLYVSAQAHQLSPGGGGQELALDWIHPLGADVTLQAGAAEASTDDAHWTYARVGGVWRGDERTVLRGLLHWGEGSAAGEGFQYRISEAALHRRLGSRVHGALSSRYVDIQQSRGNILGLGLTVQTSPRGTAWLTYHVSTSGSLDNEAVAAGAEQRCGPVVCLGGLVVGSSSSRPDTVTAAAVVASREIYAGVRVPRGGLEWTAILDRIDIEGGSRHSLITGVSIPLRSRAADAPARSGTGAAPGAE